MEHLGLNSMLDEIYFIFLMNNATIFVMISSSFNPKELE